MRSHDCSFVLAKHPIRIAAHAYLEGERTQGGEQGAVVVPAPPPPPSGDDDGVIRNNSFGIAVKVVSEIRLRYVTREDHHALGLDSLFDMLLTELNGNL